MSIAEKTPKPGWRRRPEARPDDILDAALDAFVKKGFSGATVAEIARGAGLSQGALYRYFPSKEDMLRALIRRSVTPVAAHAASLMENAEDDPAGALRMAVSFMGEAMSDPRRFAVPRLIIAEAGNFPELAEFYREEVIEVGLGALQRLIRAGVTQGQFRDVDPQAAARSIIGGLMLHMVWMTTFARADDPPLPGNIMAQHHLDIILNGMRADGGKPK